MFRTTPTTFAAMTRQGTLHARQRWAALLICGLCACNNAGPPAVPGTQAAGVDHTAAGHSAGTPANMLSGGVAAPAGGGAPASSPGIASAGPATTPGSASVGGMARAGAGAAGVAAAGSSAPTGGRVGAGAAGQGSAPADASCGANLLPVPDDLHQRGPWDVGVRTLKAGRLTLELLYPAEAGSGAGKPEATYNHSDWLPAPEQAKTTKNIAPVGAVGGHLYRDVPIDASHGPYPVVIFIHGTASMRVASITTNAHWASRGFVVLAADYPGLGLTDQLNAACGYPESGSQDVAGDVRAQLNALKEASAEYAFLKGHVDLTRLGLAGHSQGACMSATLSTIENVRVVIPISGSTQVSPAPALKSILWIAGMDDTVIGYKDSLLGNIVCPGNPLPASSDSGAYEASPGPPAVTKRLTGIRGGGHLSVTDLCQKNSLGHTDLEQMHMDNICGVDSAVIIGLPALFDCGTIDWKKAVDAVDYVTTAALEETLQCRDRSAQFRDLQKNVPELGDYQHAP